MGGRGEAQAVLSAWRTLYCLALSAGLAFAAAGCSKSEPRENQTRTADGAVDVPIGYEGPIDPQWPPSSAAKLDVEIKAARIIRQALERGEPPPLERLVEGDVADVYAEEGRIGGFDYIEVVLGPMAHPDAKMPLVILLHGRGGRPTIPPGPFLTTRPLRLFIPRGPDELKDGYNWLATWTNSGNIELLSRSLAGRVDQLMPAIKAYTKLRPTEGQPVVAGFSQGGILAYALATRYPQYFRAAIPIAAWLPPGMLPERREHADYPLIVAFHGAKDTIVPTLKGRETAEQLKRLGLDVHYSEIPQAAHVITPDMGLQIRTWIRKLFAAEPE